jgi:inorganic phosphate transporter, PiT family
MASTALAGGESLASQRYDHGIDRPTPPWARWLFLALIVGGFGYATTSVVADTRAVGEPLATGVFLFLAVALLIALGFEFVNGFHDTANAVATVIYTNAMPAPMAVVWSGVWNFLGVMTSSGAVAYSILTLLPVELILNVGSTAGYAMIFALLIAAVTWNLATWYVGLPNSSSHALIGSILGVGVANQLMASGPAGTSGVDWSQATKVLNGLWMAPLIGFGAAFVLLLVMKAVSRNPDLFRVPEGDRPPPRGIRALLILTCTGVSFAHGSNDGQKGMGLIMLILIGAAPTAYALNRTMPATGTPAYVATANAATTTFAANGQPSGDVAQSRAVLMEALRTKQLATPAVYGAAAAVNGDVTRRIADYGAISNVPGAATANLRSDMYLVQDVIGRVVKAKPAELSEGELATLSAHKTQLEQGTRYIPNWVKIAVALALGLGTMVGWKRIVVTVGEKIGKTHLTYGMGAAAELVAATTIFAADRFALPVSTTHILSSGVAGASVANGAGLQARTVRNLALAWVLTLPVAMALSGGLYWLFLAVARTVGV